MVPEIRMAVMALFARAAFSSSAEETVAVVTTEEPPPVEGRLVVPEVPDPMEPLPVATASELLFSTLVPLVVTVVPVAPDWASTLLTVPLPATVVLAPAVVTESILAPRSVLTEVPSACAVTATFVTLPATVRVAFSAEVVRVLTAASLLTVTAAPSADAVTSTVFTLPAISTAAPALSTLTVPRAPSSLTESEPSSTTTTETCALSSTATRTLPSWRETMTWEILEFPLMTMEFAPPPRTSRRPPTVTLSSSTWPSPTPSATMRSPVMCISLRVTLSALMTAEPSTSPVYSPEAL